MRRTFGIVAALFVFAIAAWAQHQHALTSEELGSVHFPTSCNRATEAGFNRAVALLHSFQYEAAEKAFGAVASADPKCAMAQWGIAMANYHGLWGNSDLNRGRGAMNAALRLASDPGTSAREKAYIDALSEIYKQD